MDNKRNSNSPTPPTHFSVHAEFTITHPGVENPINRPRTSMEHDETTGGVRMTYSWGPSSSEEPTTERKSVIKSTSNKSIFSDSPSCSSAAFTPPRASETPKIVPPSAMFSTDYTRGFQKGNMFFTSTPPPPVLEKPPEEASTKNIPKNSSLPPHQFAGIKHDSSGYGSDLLMSPNSQRISSLNRKLLFHHHPFDRKCKSTYNITLSTNTSSSDASCGRTQSLRCQTPSTSSSFLQKNPPLQQYYGCGDPWCHHQRQTEDYPFKISPVPEESFCLSANKPIKTSSKKDASVQTFEMVDKCTSPYLQRSNHQFVDRKTQKYQRRGMTEPMRRNYSPTGSIFTPDSLEGDKSVKKRAIRHTKLQRTTPLDRWNPRIINKDPTVVGSPPSSVDLKSDGDSLIKKPPRTVHIDVYCTGTEMESNAEDESTESSDEDTKSASTPQTVFENKAMRVTHRKAEEKDLPFYLRKPASSLLVDHTKKMKLTTETSVEKEESDDDDASTAYPSKLSSYSNMGDFSASASSVPRSWTTYSMSSCAIPEDYDSVANTSWKDTFSDIDSLAMSRSSLAPTDSLDHVPKKLFAQQQSSIDETPEFLLTQRKNLLETPAGSVQQSDSFEYANSEDKLRINEMEEMWRTRGASKPQKLNAKSSEISDQKRMEKYIDRKMKKWDSKDDDSESNDSDDDSGKAWTFMMPPRKEELTTKSKSPENLLPNTVRNALVRSGLEAKSPSPNRNVAASKIVPLVKECLKEREDEPNLTLVKERLSLDPSLRAPFMVIPGIYTEPRSIARKFGTVLNLMKKPGHHVGPAKNPDCLCEHCQSYWQSINYRNRTRSMGDPPTSGGYIQNWKQFLEHQSKEKDTDDGKLPFTDF